jgi:GTPase SAR1 family protein
MIGLMMMMMMICIVIMLGDAQTGKSSIVSRFVDRWRPSSQRVVGMI